MANEVRIPAAQYLRMSTEHQQYSIENQSVAVEAYAESHGFEVVRTYSDAGKSGLVLKHRAGLRQLLQDVVSGKAAYRAILVYDVSRWGRFQDSDESAHYEFLCKSAGAPVHYCAEQFPNDGSLPSLILKALKRTMAGEYSRELSVKIVAGMRRLAKLGFKMGGNPGYGLRRLLVSSSGQKKQQLGSGERKSIETDRVVLIPGAPEEIQIVRDIYRMFVSEQKNACAIAEHLTGMGIRNPSGSGTRWNSSSIRNILTHPRYTGCYAYGMTSCRLQTPRIKRPESEWVVTRGALEPIVDPKIFEKAQQRFRHLTVNLSDEELLQGLRKLLRKHGRLSTTIITKAREAASVMGYTRRFGSLVRAFELAGYGKPEHFGDDEVISRTKALRHQLETQIISLFPVEIAVARANRRSRSQLRLRDGLVMSVVIVRSLKRADGSLYWEIRPRQRDRGDLMLLARLDKSNRAFLDFHLMPSMNPDEWIRISARDHWLKQGTRLRSLSHLCDTVKHTRAPTVAE